MPDFKPNDVVQPLQGGPRMTIDKVSQTAETVTATCIWLDQKGDKQRKDFPVHDLKLVEQSAQP